MGQLNFQSFISSPSSSSSSKFTAPRLVEIAHNRTGGGGGRQSYTRSHAPNVCQTKWKCVGHRSVRPIGSGAQTRRHAPKGGVQDGVGEGVSDARTLCVQSSGRASLTRMRFVDLPYEHTQMPSNWICISNVRAQIYVWRCSILCVCVCARHKCASIVYALVLQMWQFVGI